jgi:hypothetical protein
MSLPKTFKHLALFTITACVLAACASANRNSSPNYHINSMERKDAQPYCAKDKCHRQEPKDWNKDK